MSIIRIGLSLVEKLIIISLLVYVTPVFAHTLSEPSGHAMLHNMTHSALPGYLIALGLIIALLYGIRKLPGRPVPLPSGQRLLTLGGIGLVLSGITLMLGL